MVINRVNKKIPFFHFFKEEIKVDGGNSVELVKYFENREGFYYNVKSIRGQLFSSGTKEAFPMFVETFDTSQNRKLEVNYSSPEIAAGARNELFANSERISVIDGVANFEAVPRKISLPKKRLMPNSGVLGVKITLDLSATFAPIQANFQIFIEGEYLPVESGFQE
jgi:hypothetical protein